MKEEKTTNSLPIERFIFVILAFAMGFFAGSFVTKKEQTNLVITNNQYGKAVDTVLSQAITKLQLSEAKTDSLILKIEKIDNEIDSSYQNSYTFSVIDNNDSLLRAIQVRIPATEK